MGRINVLYKSVFFGVNNSHSVRVLLSVVMTEGWYLHLAPLRHDQLLGGRRVINRCLSNFVVYKSGLVLNLCSDIPVTTGGLISP